MKKLFIVALTVLVAHTTLSLAQGVGESPKKVTKLIDKSSPELMLKGAGAPKPTPGAAGLAVSDPGDKSNKNTPKKPKK